MGLMSGLVYPALRDRFTRWVDPVYKAQQDAETKRAEAMAQLADFQAQHQQESYDLNRRGQTASITGVENQNTLFPTERAIREAQLQSDQTRNKYLDETLATGLSLNKEALNQSRTEGEFQRPLLEGRVRSQGLANDLAQLEKDWRPKQFQLQDMMGNAQLTGLNHRNSRAPTDDFMDDALKMAQIKAMMARGGGGSPLEAINKRFSPFNTITNLLTGADMSNNKGLTKTIIGEIIKRVAPGDQQLLFANPDLSEILKAYMQQGQGQGEGGLGGSTPGDPYSQGLTAGKAAVGGAARTPQDDQAIEDAVNDYRRYGLPMAAQIGLGLQ